MLVSDMNSPIKVAVVIGSLRKGSYSRKVAAELQAVAPDGMTFDDLPIGNLALFNQDLEETPPQEWLDFRSRIQAADAVLFVTPEYNRSMPGGLKNALDVGSRPYGSSAWDGKPAAIVSTSIGVIAGFGANHHLRQSLTFLNMPTMQQPEAYIGGTMQMFDESGNLVNEGTRKFLGKFMEAFADWVNKTKS